MQKCQAQREGLGNARTKRDDARKLLSDGVDPGEGCGRRVAIPFLGGKYFACRHCYQLKYASQKESKGDRGYRGAGKIREKLGWMPGIANPSRGKPKGMHWRTYNRLVLKHIRYCDHVNQSLILAFKLIRARFDTIEELLGR